MKKLRTIITATVLLAFCPAGGVLIFSSSPGQYFEFPPLTHYVKHAPFSGWAFGLYAFFTATAMAPFVLRAFRHRRKIEKRRCAAGRFPGWGWAGAGLVLTAWALTWLQPARLKDLQLYFFFPLWLGYIILASAATVRLTGNCFLLAKTRLYLLLFPLSAVFWWLFEYLNRFVQNWRYLHVEDLSADEYFLSATLCFSTVLPAVAATRELLGSFPVLNEPFENFSTVSFKHPRRAAWAALLLMCAALLLLGLWPDLLFPVLWVAPLVLLLALQTLYAEVSFFDAVRSGDWREIVQWSLAALVCGVFWELWNYGSYMKWVYHVPLVDVLHVFEMPLLGFAGYLPFGVVCGMVCREVLGGRRG